MKFRIGLLACVFTLTGLPALAQAGDGGWYGAVDLGQSKYDNGALQNLVPAGWPSTINDTDTGKRLTVGYQFNRNWGVEAGYTDLGSAKVYAKNPSPPIPDVPTYVQENPDAKGWSVAGTGTYPFNDSWSITGRLGMIDARVHDQVQSDGNAFHPDLTETGWKTTYGLGLNWNFDPQWSFRLGYDWFRNLGDSGTTGEYNVSLLSLGVAYRFY